MASTAFLTAAARTAATLASPAMAASRTGAWHRATAAAAAASCRGVAAHGLRSMSNLAGFADYDTTSNEPKTSVVLTTDDRAGSLNEVLGLFVNSGVNMTHISSKPRTFEPDKCDFFIDFQGDAESNEVQALLGSLSKVCADVQLSEPLVVPWFPTKISDIDHFSGKTLDAGAELESDHPGFNDAEYRERRRMIVAKAGEYRHGDELPYVDYTDKETETWGTVYEKLQSTAAKYGATCYKEIMHDFEKYVGYGPGMIPQLEDISQFLHGRTGFRLRPVAGLLSARDFLNGLAFKVFFSTQYIRHWSEPLYTPEPDIVHELLGHAPMFADPGFAKFSHEIGLASLGATDADIRRLATCYWFSVEFGLVKEDDGIKAYGAGLLSSFGELEYACSPDRPAGGTMDMPEYRPWVPADAATTDYPITCYQPTYFLADSMEQVEQRMRAFCEHEINRPFNVRYDSEQDTVWVDRLVTRDAYQPTLQKA